MTLELERYETPVRQVKTWVGSHEDLLVCVSYCMIHNLWGAATKRPGFDSVPIVTGISSEEETCVALSNFLLTRVSLKR